MIQIVQYAMKRENLKTILENDGYKKSSIDSILSGRRCPNAEKRYEYEEKYNIPFKAWRDIKSYLQTNNTKEKNSEQESGGVKV